MPLSPSPSRAALAKLGFLGVLLALLTAAAVGVDWWRGLPPDATASYVGGDTCISCHQQQATDWHGSHHDLAMDVASEDTVLGDFNNATLEHYGITSRMFRDGEKFMVSTEGPDGAIGDFEVKYVFGVDPLQQYMVELDPPGGDGQGLGRVQVLRISWDTRRRKWFYLSPPDVDEKLAPDDPLHWTGVAQNWNHMCAECHSTNLVKGYDFPTRTYHTTFTDIDVNCEACHGPGSLHVTLANRRSLFWDRKLGYGLVAMKGAPPEVQIQACTPCHSRRSVLKQGYTCGANYYDYYENSLLTPTTYYPDGQILDEVYVFGSFLQSKMHAKGIRCTDCHEPHSTKVKHQDNQLCTSCHQHDPAKYDTPAHHHHPLGSTGTLCIDCHMLPMPYMDIDLRRDHSFQVPHPDVSTDLDTPNACVACHLQDSTLAAEQRGPLEYYADWLTAARNGNELVAAELDRLNRWAAEQISAWYGTAARDDRPAFARTLQRGWEGDGSVVPELAALATNRQAAGIVRATALATLAEFPASPLALQAARQSLGNDDPQVRAAAIGVYENVPPPQRLVDVGPLLEDPIRHVRMQAALALVEANKSTFSRQRMDAMKAALEDYRQAQRQNADLAGSHIALGLLAERQADFRRAEQCYRDAMRVQPLVAGPRSNLANLLSEHLDRPEEAAQLWREELEFVGRDARLAPRNHALQYRLGLNYYLNGQLEEAEEALREAADSATGQRPLRADAGPALPEAGAVGGGHHTGGTPAAIGARSPGPPPIVAATRSQPCSDPLRSAGLLASGGPQALELSVRRQSAAPLSPPPPTAH